MPEGNRKPRSFLGKVFFVLKFLEIRLRFVAILAVTALVVGYWDHILNHYERYQREHKAEQMTSDAGVPGGSSAKAETEKEYYCGMHPFVVRDRPDKCPICGMELSEREKGAAATLPEGTLARVQVSPQRVAQAGIQVEPVLFRLLIRTIRSYGVVEAEEKRIARISARFPGLIQELAVDTVGVVVKKGDPLARIYSPKYLAASQEYVRALAASQKEVPFSDPERASIEKDRREEMVSAARKRLLLGGYTAGQLDALAENRAVSDTVMLHAPLSGTVIEKAVVAGEMVEEGTVLFTVADLAEVWVQARVPEADLAAVKVGMPVEITTVAWPGRIFYGNAEFIYPVIDDANRTVKVRIAVANPEGSLKPGLYANAVIRSPVGQFRLEEAGMEAVAKADAGVMQLPTGTQEDADVFVQALEDGIAYYGCPMDPQVVSDKAGDCPLCGMKLERHKKESVPKDPAATGPSLPTQVQEEADRYLRSIKPGARYFACSMHAEVVSDKAGDCPLCGMRLEGRVKETAPVSFGSESGALERWTIGFACAMHPDELSDQPGVCRTCNCGMVMSKWKAERVASVPESAVVDTGNRKIVYVEFQPGVYDARSVTLGHRVGNFYPVIDGLAVGQRIVSQGAFLVDAEARLNPVMTESVESAEHVETGNINK